MFDDDKMRTFKISTLFAIILLTSIACSLGLRRPDSAELSDAIKNLGSHDPDVRYYAIRQISQYEIYGRPAFPELRLCLYDDDPNVRSAAILAIVGMGRIKHIRPELIKLLDDDNWQVRGVSAGAIELLGPVAMDAIPKLVQMLHDNSSSNRRAAVDALSSMGESAKWTIPDIEKLRNDEDEYVRERANLAIQILRGEAEYDPGLVSPSIYLP